MAALAAPSPGIDMDDAARSIAHLRAENERLAAENAQLRQMILGGICADCGNALEGTAKGGIRLRVTRQGVNGSERSD